MLCDLWKIFIQSIKIDWCDDGATWPLPKSMLTFQFIYECVFHKVFFIKFRYKVILTGEKMASNEFSHANKSNIM